MISSNIFYSSLSLPFQSLVYAKGDNYFKCVLPLAINFTFLNKYIYAYLGAPYATKCWETTFSMCLLSCYQN